MPPIEVKVHYSEEKGGWVDPETVCVEGGTGATLIQWTLAHDATGFTITGLDPEQFKPRRSRPEATSFTTTDKNDKAHTYNYYIKIFHANGSHPRFDPKIQNGAPPPPPRRRK